MLCQFRRFVFVGFLSVIGLGLALFPVQPVLAQGAPVVEVWSGLTQQFGHIGAPQPWANILGNVSDADGISSLSYTLNGGSAVTLTVGSDGRRLQSTGDFNVDLATADLLDGPNTVVITAVDGAATPEQTQVTVTVNYDGSGNVWPLPDTVEWSTAGAIEDVSQIVDGKWELTPGGAVRTTIPGYDRLIAMGDMAWDDYEITVPITIHTMPSDLGTGILLRWNGHTDTPIAGTQPKSGYLPLGAICWYRSGRLEIYGNNGDILDTQSRTLSPDVPYLFKAQVETNPGIGGYYKLKVWEEGQPEPAGWDVTGQEDLSDPQSGSMMLISHKADASFGNVQLGPIPLSISDITVTLGAGDTEATIDWITSEPASGSVAYGLTTGYELGSVSDAPLVTSHSFTLTGLTPGELYHYQITSIDGPGNAAVTGDRTFTTITSGLVSDDFSSPILNTSVWTYVDPVGDGSYSFTGTNTSDAWVDISVPAGVEHQVWTNGIQVPYLLQAVNNADFEIEVKMESSVDLQYQEQGILIKQDDGNYIRFEFYNSASSTKVYAATFESMAATQRINADIATGGTAPLYMRVRRQGSQWTQTYSFDGSSWLSGASFTHAVTTTGIGIYAGNATGTGSPAHTASFDYFFNTASPVVPEDPTLTWTISNVVATPGENSATITWTTDEPTTSSVAYGPTTAYELGVESDPALVTSHSVTLTGLSSLTSYHFQVSSEDVSANVITAPDMTFTTIGQDNSGIVSDDFHAPVLNTSLWTLVDPLSDVVFSLTGQGTQDAWANLQVPAGVAHEVHDSGIQAPHLLQSANDTDFEVEVKFESPVTAAFQEQGIVIKQDDSNYLRFEFYGTATNTVLYARGYTPSTSPTYNSVNVGANGTAPVYMRVARQGDLWTQSYSFDGTTWTSRPAFSHVLAVSGLGPYVGNAVGATSPSHMASIDYFFNTASPIDPEDAVVTTPSVVAANTGSAGVLSTANPCEAGVPVEITRGGAENLRAFSVTVHLANLALCDGVASIQEGAYLGTGGATTFQVIDNQDGTHTVDSTILDDPCGATDPGGVLFTLDVNPTIGDGSGTITLTDLDLRDCDNQPLAVSAGPAADILIDTTPPLGVTDLTAAPVLSGNPEGNVTAVALAWTPSTDPSAVQTVIYRKGFGGYPEYDDAGGAIPALPTDPATEGWDSAGSVPAAQASYEDLPGARDFWYFCAVTVDQYGNESTALMAGGVLNYLLGDVTDGGDPFEDGDNQVAISDVTMLGSQYGFSSEDSGFLSTLDIGPTDNTTKFGRPTTDGVIDFEDLMFFAINFDLDVLGAAPAMAFAQAAADQNTLALDIQELPPVGTEFMVPVVMSGDGQVQALRIPLQWNEKVLKLEGFQAGTFLAEQGGPTLALSAEHGVLDVALVGLRAGGISGTGPVARAVFRVVGEGAANLQLNDPTARDRNNKAVLINAEAPTEEIVRPRVSALHPNYPNPFNPSTTISFDLATQGRVRISIFALDGRLVKTLVDGVYTLGRHEQVWSGKDNDGRSVASGTYLYRMEGPGILQNRRMLLVK